MACFAFLYHGSAPIVGWPSHTDTGVSTSASNSRHRRFGVATNGKRSIVSRSTCWRQSTSRLAIGRRWAGTRALIGRRTGIIKWLPGDRPGRRPAAAAGSDDDDDDALTAGSLTPQIARSVWRKHPRRIEACQQVRNSSRSGRYC